MKKYLLLIFIIIYGCNDINKSDQDYALLKDSCEYSIIINNKEMIYVKSYSFINNGNIKAIYLRRHNCSFDTVIIGGNFSITPLNR